MSELTLDEKLLKAQLELKAPKNQYNSFSKFKYRSAEDILESVKPINKKYGLLLVLYDEPLMIGDWHYIKATAEITDGEESYRITAYARESQVKKGMDDSQITGTASSYARKYALNGLYLIDDTKDADTDEYQKNVRTSKQDNYKPITQKQVGDIKLKAKQFAEMRGQDEPAVYKALNISDVTKTSQDMAEKTIKTLDSWIKKASDEKS